MATKLLLLLPILSLLALSTTVSARPGNTFIISTYSFSFVPLNPRNPNPNPNNPEFVIMDLRPARRFFLLPVHRFEMTDLPLRLGFKDRFPADIPRQSEITNLPLGLSSMMERTKDILSVVASLLFGAACGALTAGTMYLVWSIVNFRHGGGYRSVEEFSSDDDDDDDVFNPKKSHYVVVPADVVDQVKVKETETETETV
ncbi:hypothetical protein RND81_04G038400 [Saponaria officinalis]|uniref:Uncharacterized protein n=1 Tax=Saponaria officinalis TaxID=3572 RepID=A0AAW1LHP1_SAPOF